MTALLDDKTRDQLTGMFGELASPVRLIFFSQEVACPNCREQRQVLDEVASLSDRISLEVHEFARDGALALDYGIDKIPATVVLGTQDHGIRFFGLTVGYEFSSLIEAILMVSRGDPGLSDDVMELVARIREPVHLQVMVTLTCPYCPTTVHGAHQLAMASPQIRADMVEAGEFATVARRYDVSGVPKTVINERHSVEGALPAEALLVEVLKAVQPEDLRRLQDAVLEARGDRKVRTADAGHVYETVIVGGGPAALSAALYAARKDLDVLLLGRDTGGQMNDTALIDNYLGLPDINGPELTERFRRHAERYPFAERIGVEIERITVEDGVFELLAADGTRYRGRSVIYCAGKTYRRLGIPREEAFIGRGIAFCATCDAPLYRDKKVAVVGGGNSAFTALRDLAGFAAELHLVHRRDAFTADPALIRDVEKAPQLRLHKGMVVRDILGGDRLEGLRLMSTDGEKREDIMVDGVFLEIGLNPNSGAVKGLLPLNEKGEIPVDGRNATSVPGFFAAGDVTDVFEKQIVIAVGDGAKAALAAHSYLIEKGLTRSRVEVGETWT